MYDLATIKARNSIASGKLDTTDPRADGFNYGAGWPKSLPYPEVFQAAQTLRELIAEESLQWSNAEWELGQAIRTVRLASHPLEQKAAVEALHAAKAKAQAFFDTGRQAQTEGVKSLLPDTPKAGASNGSGFSLGELHAANAKAQAFFDTGRQAQTEGAEVRRMMVCSTSHVDLLDAQWLTEQAEATVDHQKAGHPEPKFPVGATVYGWFFRAPPSDADFPEFLRGIIEAARNAGCDYVMLDRDAEELDGVPTFDW